MLAPKGEGKYLSPAMIKFNEHDDQAYKTKALKKALIPTEAGFEEIIRWHQICVGRPLQRQEEPYTLVAADIEVMVLLSATPKTAAI